MVKFRLEQWLEDGSRQTSYFDDYNEAVLHVECFGDKTVYYSIWKEINELLKMEVIEQ